MNKRPVICATVIIAIICLFPPRATDQTYSGENPDYAARGCLFDPYFRIAEINGSWINIGKVKNGSFAPAHLDTGRLLAEIGLVICIFFLISQVEPKKKK